MGGCLSNNTPSKHPRISHDTHIQNTNISKSPPPSHEEETVKEVLSETPSQRARVDRGTNGPFIKHAPLLLHELKDHRDVDVFYKKPPYAAHGGGDDVSGDLVSESESVSVRLRHQSPARRDRTIDKSPNRARPGPRSENLKRGDGGERSGRRSRSPVTRTDSGDSGRSTFSRKTGKSPGRVRSGSGERTRKVDGEREVVGDNMWPPTSVDHESLENPVVSMECFIFL